MTLDEVKLSRRNFLKLLGAAAAGAAAPNLVLGIEQPAYTLPFLKDMPARQRHIFTPHWSLVEGDGVLSCSVLVPPTAQGKGEVQLYWASEGDAEIGWWSDYLELHKGQAGELLSTWLAFPETVVRLENKNQPHVNKDCLGQIEMLPDQLLVIALCVPYPWGAESPLEIHGLQIDYEAM